MLKDLLVKMRDLLFPKDSAVVPQTVKIPKRAKGHVVPVAKKANLHTGPNSTGADIIGAEWVNGIGHELIDMVYVAEESETYAMIEKNSGMKILPKEPKDGKYFMCKEDIELRYAKVFGNFMAPYSLKNITKTLAYLDSQVLTGHEKGAVRAFIYVPDSMMIEPTHNDGECAVLAKFQHDVQHGRGFYYAADGIYELKGTIKPRSVKQVLENIKPEFHATVEVWLNAGKILHTANELKGFKSNDPVDIKINWFIHDSSDFMPPWAKAKGLFGQFERVHEIIALNRNVAKHIVNKVHEFMDGLASFDAFAKYIEGNPVLTKVDDTGAEAKSNLEMVRDGLPARIHRSIPGNVATMLGQLFKEVGEYTVGVENPDFRDPARLWAKANGVLVGRYFAAVDHALTKGMISLPAWVGTGLVKAGRIADIGTINEYYLVEVRRHPQTPTAAQYVKVVIREDNYSWIGLSYEDLARNLGGDADGDKIEVFFHRKHDPMWVIEPMDHTSVRPTTLPYMTTKIETGNHMWDAVAGVEVGTMVGLGDTIVRKYANRTTTKEGYYNTLAYGSQIITAALIDAKKHSLNGEPVIDVFATIKKMGKEGSVSEWESIYNGKAGFVPNLDSVKNGLMYIKSVMMNDEEKPDMVRYPIAHIWRSAIRKYFPKIIMDIGNGFSTDAYLRLRNTVLEMYAKYPRLNKAGFIIDNRNGIVKVKNAVLDKVMDIYMSKTIGCQARASAYIREEIPAWLNRTCGNSGLDVTNVWTIVLTFTVLSALLSTTDKDGTMKWSFALRLVNAATLRALLNFINNGVLPPDQLPKGYNPIQLTGPAVVYSGLGLTERHFDVLWEALGDSITSHHYGSKG